MPFKLVDLKPIKESSADFEAMEKRIQKLFKQMVYFPILKELGLSQKTIQNDADDYKALSDALFSGRVTFSRGTFSGRFSASITKELKDLGARWDRKTGTFKVPLSSLPIEIRSLVTASETRFAEKMASIDKRLGEILPEDVAAKLSTADLFDSTLWKTDKAFQHSVKNITIAPQLTPERRKKIADEWQNNMKLWIKDFTQKEIKELRATIQKTAFGGDRYESIVKKIQDSYGVTARKAKFLARQETSLLMAKFKETRYVEAGIDEYTWGCVAGSKNHPVRPSHKVLQGKTFRWDNPPITTAAGEPVRRNNPGQDYNCRCFARPKVKVKI